MIYHVARRADWEAASAAGEYRISTLGRTLEQEGFLHCSRADQVAGVLGRYYADEPGPLLLLSIDPDACSAPVQDDEVAPGVVFPHIYGPLRPADVIAVEPLVRDASGWRRADS